MKQNSRFRKFLSMFMVLAMLMQYGISLPVFADDGADSAALEAAAAQEAKAAQEAEEKAKREAEERKAAEEAAAQKAAAEKAAAAQRAASENVSSDNGSNSDETPALPSSGETEQKQGESQGQVETGQDNTQGQEQLDLENARAPDEGETLNAESGQTEATVEEGTEEEPVEEEQEPEEETKTFTVTFTANDKTVKTVDVEENKAIGEDNMPSDPEKEFYSFEGWYDGSTEITKDTVVTGNITASAKFSPNYYTVTFVEDTDDDGTYETTILTKQIDKENAVVGALPEDPFVAGKDFLGWYSESGAAISADTAVSGDMVIHALFDSIHIYKVTINYFYIDGTGTNKVFDKNILTVDGRKIAGTSKSIESPAHIEVDDATVEHHDAHGNIFYPKQQTVVVDSALLSTADEANNVNVMVEYVPYTAEYTIVYRLEGLSGGWDEIESVEEKGVLGSTVTPPVKNYDYATLVSAEPVKITQASGQKLYVDYKRKDFTLNFDTQGGNNVDGVSAPYGSKVNLPGEADVTKNGYTFNGWFTDPECTKQAATPFELKENTTLYADWVGAKVDYTIVYMFEKYNDNGTASSYEYDNSEKAQANVGETVKATDPSIPEKTRKGYEKDDARNETSSVEIKADGSSVLYVYYKLKTYTFRFNAGSYYYVDVNANLTDKGVSGTGTLGYTMSVKLGQSISSSWPMSVTGYYNYYGRHDVDFAGWKPDGVASIYVTKRLIVTDDMLPSSGSSITYTAQWIDSGEVYTVNYWLQNADDNGYTKSAEYSQTINYAAGGMNLSAKEISGFTYDKSKDDHKYKGRGRDRYIYEYNFYYDRDTYKIDYYYNSTSLKTIDKVKFDANINSGTYNWTPAAPEGMEDYTWGGWYSDENLSAKYTFATMPAHNLKLYAKWIAPEKTVTFHNNYSGAEPEVFNQQTVLKNEYAEDPGSPSRDYYEFLGWYTAPEGGARFVASATKVTADMDVYAHWNMVPLKYTVRYLENGTEKVLFPEKKVESSLLKVDDVVTEDAAAIPSYLPDSASKNLTLVSDPEKNIITFWYSEKTGTNKYTVNYVLKENPSVKVAESKTDVEVDGATSSVTEMAAAVDKAVMASSGASEDELAQTYHPTDVTMSLTLSQDPAQNVITFEYLPYESARFTVKYIDMDGEDIAGAPARSEVVPSGSTETVATSLEGYTLVSNTDDQGGSNKTRYNITGGTPITVTLQYKKNLTIRANDKEKTYDGTALVSDGAEDSTAIGLLDGDSLSAVTYTGSQTDAGSSYTVPGNAIISHNGSSGSDYYAVSYVRGTLTVKPAEVHVMIDPDRWTGNTYNGRAYDAGFTNPAKTAEDYITINNAAYKAQYLDTIWNQVEGKVLISEKDAGTYTLAGREIRDKINIPADENYTITTEVRESLLEIKPAELTVTTGSATKPYDGTALTNDEASVTGLVNGETATATATGSQTEVGSSPNTYSITWGTAKESNYVIKTKKLGTLEVTKGSVVITVKGSKDELEYNGEEHSVTGYELSSKSAGFDKSKVVFTGNAVVKGTDANTYPMGLQTSDFSYSDTNVDATFKVTDGELKITPKAVTVTADDKSRVYNTDNPALTAKADGTVGSDTVNYTLKLG